jgi:hypothetical protein|eukprot:COSAG02_NODE_1799_length_10896_cov_8.648421_2_plen_46_part_00
MGIYALPQPKCFRFLRQLPDLGHGTIIYALVAVLIPATFQHMHDW